MSMANSSVAWRWALRGFPASKGRRGPYHACPFLIKRGQLNIASGERAGLVAVWATRAEAAQAKRQGVRRITPKLQIVRVIVSVDVWHRKDRL
jgi:hypothetical protein